MKEHYLGTKSLGFRTLRLNVERLQLNSWLAYDLPVAVLF